LNYNFINTSKYDLSELGVIRTNNKIGVVFEMPLLLRKERGKLQQVRIKQLQIANDQRQLTREIINDVNASYNLLTNLRGLIELQTDVVKNQTFLLLAEQEKFKIGESSLFLINSRESKLIDQKIKAEELKAKYEKALAELVYSAGQSSLP
jgi:outer membrane protein